MELSALEQAMELLRQWIAGTGLHAWVRSTTWAWIAAESVHFIGLSLLVATVGMFDLRLLGVARSVSPRSLHRLIPLGLLGFALNLLTGAVFVAGAPEQYLYNRAFHFKTAFILLAGINALVFYLAMYRSVDALGPGDEAPRGAKVIAGISLLLWIGVMTAGRLLTFFRPPFAF